MVPHGSPLRQETKHVTLSKSWKPFALAALAPKAHFLTLTFCLLFCFIKDCFRRLQTLTLDFDTKLHVDKHFVCVYVA